ncbi:MAG: LysM peptidoglycan-binding domain-containing M23 family metallopeptidase [Spirochaetota bacterium]
MISWMSAKDIRFIIILLIFHMGCVPPAYRHSPDIHKKNSTQKTYQQFNYNEDESTPIISDEDNYYIKNEIYSTQPVYYVTPQVESDASYQNSQSNENNTINKSYSKGRWHIIKKGETLYRLSKQYNTTVDAICDANNITDFTTIKVGQKIFIPSNVSVKNSQSKKSPADQKPPKKIDTNFSFIWPVPSVITYTRDQGGVRPIGIIINSSPKSKVVASAEGTIAKIGAMRGFGNFVVIMHKKDFYTIYSKLDAITVKEGQSVVKGTTIGFLSDSNPSLHFQINHSGKPLDPLHYLAQK